MAKFWKERQHRDSQCDVPVGHPAWCLQQGAKYRHTRYTRTRTHACTDTQTPHTPTHAHADTLCSTHTTDTHTTPLRHFARVLNVKVVKFKHARVHQMLRLLNGACLSETTVKRTVLGKSTAKETLWSLTHVQLFSRLLSTATKTPPDVCVRSSLLAHSSVILAASAANRHPCFACLLCATPKKISKVLVDVAQGSERHLEILFVIRVWTVLCCDTHRQAG